MTDEKVCSEELFLLLFVQQIFSKSMLKIELSLNDWSIKSQCCLQNSMISDFVNFVHSHFTEFLDDQTLKKSIVVITVVMKKSKEIWDFDDSILK